MLPLVNRAFLKFNEVFIKLLSLSIVGELEEERGATGQSDSFLSKGPQHRQPGPRSSAVYGSSKGYGTTTTSTQHRTPEETQ